MILFQYEMSDDHSTRIITALVDDQGMIVMAVMFPEQWQMVCDIVDLTGELAEDVVMKLVEDGSIGTIELDPKEF